MTLAAKLRHRVTLQTRTGSQDATTGETTFTWSNTVADEPAEVVPLSGRVFVGLELRPSVFAHRGLFC